MPGPNALSLLLGNKSLADMYNQAVLALRKQQPEQGPSEFARSAADAFLGLPTTDEARDIAKFAFRVMSQDPTVAADVAPTIKLISEHAPELAAHLADAIKQNPATAGGAGVGTLAGMFVPGPGKFRRLSDAAKLERVAPQVTRALGEAERELPHLLTTQERAAQALANASNAGEFAAVNRAQNDQFGAIIRNLSPESGALVHDAMGGSGINPNQSVEILGDIARQKTDALATAAPLHEVPQILQAWAIVESDPATLERLMGLYTNRLASRLEGHLGALPAVPVVRKGAGRLGSLPDIPVAQPGEGKLGPLRELPVAEPNRTLRADQPTGELTLPREGTPPIEPRTNIFGGNRASYEQSGKLIFDSLRGKPDDAFRMIRRMTANDTQAQHLTAQFIHRAMLANEAQPAEVAWYNLWAIAERMRLGKKP